MIGSDLLGLSCGAGPHKGRPHPRMYGTFPRVPGRYVREGLFSHERAVAKMTGQPAAKLHLRQRGLIRECYFADLALFDPETVCDEATFEQPHRYPSGILTHERQPGRRRRAVQRAPRRASSRARRRDALMRKQRALWGNLNNIKALCAIWSAQTALCKRRASN